MQRNKSFDDFDDEPEEPKMDPVTEAMLIGLREHLRTYYKPVFKPEDAEMHMTTVEVWQQLLKLFPNELYLTRSLVAGWLSELGFHYFDYGEMSLEWMMKKR